MRASYDVIVVGGDVRALALVWVLASEGAKTALLAPGEIAAAADERAWPVARAAHRFRWRSASDAASPKLARRFARAQRSGVPVTASGCLTLTDSSEEAEKFGRAAEAFKGDGLSAWMVPAREVAALSPPLGGRDRIGPGLYEPGALTLDADALAQGLARAAAEHGAQLFQRMPVDHIERDGEAATGVAIAGAVVSAGAVVLADDQSAIRLIREGKGRLSLTRDERIVLKTAADAPAIGPAIALDDLRISRDQAGAITASGPIGGDEVARRLVALAPALAGLGVVSQDPVTIWTGVDGLPQVGAAEIANLWLALGYGRDALSLAPVAAEHLGALIAGRRGMAAVEAFAPTRRPALRGALR